MKILYLLLVLFTFYNSSSQETRFNRYDSTEIMSIGYMSYNLDSTDKSNLSQKLPFGNITFLDKRYDTTFIAINWQTSTKLMVGKKIQNRKFNLNGGLAAGLTSYINSFYKPNLSPVEAQVVCYIKRFSVNLVDTLLEEMSSRESINTIRFEVECYYMSGDSLYPALRIDTSYGERISKIKSTFPELMKNIIHPLVERLAAIDAVKVRKRNSYTVQQIRERYQSRFNLPILTTNEYKRGVYRTFGEFINNAPSITDYQVKEEHYRTLLFDSDGRIIPRAFGFCDGQTCWKFGGAFCSPLVRVSNSFEYFYKIYVVSNYMTTTRKYLVALNMER